jgi:hypothetical protein
VIEVELGFTKQALGEVTPEKPAETALICDSRQEEGHIPNEGEKVVTCVF